MSLLKVDKNDLIQYKRKIYRICRDPDFIAMLNSRRFTMQELKHIRRQLLMNIKHTESIKVIVEKQIDLNF